MSQGIYWLGTLPEETFAPVGPLLPGVQYIRGQLEIGEGTGYRHWQILLVLCSKQRLSYVRERFPGGHWELSRSVAADEYVWKEETRVDGTQFELGTRKTKRNSPTDWENIRTLAKSGQLELVPADVYIRCFHQLRSIKKQFVRPVAMLRQCYVYWGKSGTGKSRRAFDEAGELCYVKDPRSFFLITEPNGGTVIAASQMLSSMNFVELSMSVISCDGWTDTQYLWSQKEEVNHYVQQHSGSHPI